MLQPFNRIFGLGDKSSSKKEDEMLNTDEVVQLPVDQIEPNRFQPRYMFDEVKIQELAQTIEIHGVIQPIVVRKTDESGYEIIAGERRWRAVRSLNWNNIPAIIRDMTDTETASVALIENLQREELTVIEEASAYQGLLEMHALTQEALAQRLGKSQSTIANKIRLLKLPEQIQTALLQKDITERHARSLIRLKDDNLQLDVLEQILEHSLNVKETEQLIQRMFEPKRKEKTKRPKQKSVSKDIRLAMNTIRQSLTMVSDTGIDISSDEIDHDDYYQITIKIPKKNE